MVLQGMTGCGNAEPGGCFITAHDLKTGAEKWRVWTIAHPGDRNFDTLERAAAGKPVRRLRLGRRRLRPAAEPGVLRRWPAISLDRRDARHAAGERRAEGLTNTALYSDSTLAIDPKTGKVKWYHQYLQNDTWDLDYVYERMLIDLPFNGTTRKMVVTTGKLGIIEALDRTTGEWLWAKQTVPQNVVAVDQPEDRREDHQPGGRSRISARPR